MQVNRSVMVKNHSITRWSLITLGTMTSKLKLSIYGQFASMFFLNRSQIAKIMSGMKKA